MTPTLFSSRKFSSILLLLFSLLISIALGVWNGLSMPSSEQIYSIPESSITN
jgi:hypothetical protein